jgi:hypothetical protein
VRPPDRCDLEGTGRGGHRVAEAGDIDAQQLSLVDMSAPGNGHRRREICSAAISAIVARCHQAVAAASTAATSPMA